MFVPMTGDAEVKVGNVFVVERMFYKGSPLPLGRVYLRWLLSAGQRGYLYPGKVERDVLGNQERIPSEPPVGVAP